MGLTLLIVFLLLSSGQNTLSSFYLVKTSVLEHVTNIFFYFFIYLVTKRQKHLKKISTESFRLMFRGWSGEKTFPIFLV